MRGLLVRLRALVHRGAAERAIDEELRYHIERETDRHVARGLPLPDARLAARRAFGNMTGAHEAAREAFTFGTLEQSWQDVRYALRQMRRHPGFTAIAVLTVGLGIGATVALASVADAVIVRALPYANEDRIHVFWGDDQWRADEYDFLCDRKGVFSELAAFSDNDDPYVVDPRSSTGARELRFVVATANLFDVLGVKPALGPGITADDDRPHAAQVIVISYGMWQQDLGGDPNVIGRRIVIGGAPVTIVGVMPKGFYFPTPEYRAWRPLQIDPAGSMYRVGYLVLVGRTPAGTPLERVNDDVQRMAHELGLRFTYPATRATTSNRGVTSVHAYLLGNVRDPVLLLLAAVALLLAIASANTAALVLARTSDRSQEMMVRTALGAESWRLIRQIGTESLILSLAAACIGAGIAAIGFRVLVARLPLGNGVGDMLSPGLAVPAVAFGLALVVACAIAIAPARGLLKRRFDAALSRERSEAGLRRGARRVHAVIIGAQVSFAIVLAVGAALLIRSVDRIRALDLGFDPQGVATITIVPRGDAPSAASAQFLSDVVSRTSALPGVTAVGLINRLPVRDGGYQGVVSVEGRPDLDGPNRPTALYRKVTPGFFGALGMRVVAGREIDSTDVATSVPVTVISESFARAMWPGQNAIGRHVGTRWTGMMVSRQVVGVVKETRMTSMTGEIPFAMFVPLEQSGGANGEAVLAVRTTGSIPVLIAQVTRIAADLDRLAAVTNVGSMEDVVATAIAQPLRLRFFLGVFATLAILLSAVGVYGTVRYAVARRRAEFGIQLALGATPSRVLSGVVRQALTPVVLGALAGIGGTLYLSRALRGFVYGVAPSDPTSLVVATGSLLVAAIVAAVVPALQASRTSPAASLRAE